jgi:hypothetical protein
VVRLPLRAAAWFVIAATDVIALRICFSFKSSRRPRS